MYAATRVSSTAFTDTSAAYAAAAAAAIVASTAIAALELTGQPFEEKPGTLNVDDVTALHVQNVSKQLRF
eukprot:CAMPEP_0171828314 /NCGR_PEP_ID=MMETSP0992-20121227/7107_1 /TAXON_ID=483369 /ORGANISM="non described non described, Strain CCMP2098" /LENGTH=69 /DNA_ID=CAMNT_0012443509 /DNA_START=75 /DNA_END=283 /DNA_ORIENTATION=-